MARQKGFTLSEEHKERIRQGMLGKNAGSANGMWGKKGIENPMYGKTRPDMVGVLNHNYKHGLSNKRKRSATEPRYKHWQKRVFERDNWDCQHCGKHGGTLNAHHIKGWTAYPELRYDVDNGLTLCPDCHSALHYGKKVA